jgi:hypothetical protein
MGAYVSPIPAKVASVHVRGTSWSQAMLDRLAADGLGGATGSASASAGYSVPYANTSAAADTVPWTGVNQISITFTEGVVAAQNDLVVTGVNVASYPTTAFTYDNLTRTATWTLAAPIGDDKVLIVLNDSVTDLIGDPLDGDATASYPSGDGAAGSDFRLRFNVLAGDVNQSRAVDAADFRAVLDAQFKGAADAGYFPRRDIDANGAINVLDLALARDHSGHALPGGEPAGSPSAGVPLAEPVPPSAGVPLAMPVPGAVIVELAPDLRTARILRGPAAGTRLSQSRPHLSESSVDHVLGAVESENSTSALRVLRARRGSHRAL